MSKTREFESGATRNSEEGKFDYEGFLSPTVIERYAKYLHEHRQLEDGTLRDSDNWQKGMPLSAYMKSLWRHLMTAWTWHRSSLAVKKGKVIEDALCGVIFNASGYLHELLRVKVGEREVRELPQDASSFVDAGPVIDAAVRVSRDAGFKYPDTGF